VIYKRQGQGTFVGAKALEESRRQRRKVVSALLEKAIVEGANAGISRSEIDELYEQLLRRYGLEQP
jgi:DNA-binding transcriptional regulator YhcF (GntR family)